MTAASAVLLAVASELAALAKGSMPEMRDGEAILREWLADGVYCRETVFKGKVFQAWYDFRQRKKPPSGSKCKVVNLLWSLAAFAYILNPRFTLPLPPAHRLSVLMSGLTNPPPSVRYISFCLYILILTLIFILVNSFIEKILQKVFYSPNDALNAASISAISSAVHFPQNRPSRRQSTVCNCSQIAVLVTPVA